MKNITAIISYLLIFSLLLTSCMGLDEILPEKYKGTPPSDIIDIVAATDLSSEGTANSYVVSKGGIYSISAVKGNSDISVGSVASVEVLWESFGTDVQPAKGDLVEAVIFQKGKIYFKTSSVYREGNAVIAAKNASGTILWSWHIWLTDQPQEHVYNNNAGTMMDRNLGATSATPGDVGALGLFYQWGRKDPFLGAMSISSETKAKSTLTLLPKVSSTISTGTIEYATANPTTFITCFGSSNMDWYYTGSEHTDDTRWQSEKTIYDPCPVGWRVPDGGSNGIWSKAGFIDTPDDRTNMGISFNINSPATTWYPHLGVCGDSNGLLGGVGYIGYYWTVTPSSNFANCMYIGLGEGVQFNYSSRSSGFGVRCFKEGSEGVNDGPGSDASDMDTAAAMDLSSEGTANSYIVSEEGIYSISAVKGNSEVPVGTVASVEVLWESFGTDVQPAKGDLIEAVIFQKGKIYFKTSSVYREGNAVVAAKDASGSILWSWHIWFTDQPEEQVYYNNAGTMMDRNLGATSATPGEVGALGLLYQWGRKDPFLGSSSISKNAYASSTITWPTGVISDFSSGTIEYTIANPTTFVTYNDLNGDWYFTGSDSTDDTRWQSEKTIYDPCPLGWRVPDGGETGVWSKASGISLDFSHTFDSSNYGMDFSNKFGSDHVIWYPAAGRRYFDDGSMSFVGRYGSYWSVTPSGSKVHFMDLYNYDKVWPSDSYDRVQGYSVRCFKEDLNKVDPELGGVTYTVAGTINGAIWEVSAPENRMVFENGCYVLKDVELLWESNCYGGDGRIAFKIVETGSWYGYFAKDGKSYGLGEEIEVAYNDAYDIHIGAPEGLYDIYFDKTNEKVWVMTPGAAPETPVTPVTEGVIWENDGTVDAATWS
ncbi:MAG: hypothetical protein J6S01_11055, partial [Bacteroidales bacterium]|nr:hypothetical protein [Bacteroidales bacterium]